MTITITPAAESYLAELLAKQEDDDVALRIFISDAGTPQAEAAIAYCLPGEELPDDERLDYKGFIVWIDNYSKPFLDGALLEYADHTFGGQLTIKAPNSRSLPYTEDSKLEDKINYVLHNQINPGLASHGGVVNLVEVDESDIVVLQFGGGCQGCGMVDVTLKAGVEKTLLEQLPEIKGIRDITDHTQNENAYYA